MPSPEDAATLQALFEGVDGAREEAEREWGRERLPLLVSTELREKFRRQETRWSQAIQAAWNADHLTGAMLDAVRSAAGGMQRAYAAISAAAAEAGHRPIAPWVWEVPLPDGKVAAFVQTNDEAAKVLADGRHLVVYTLAEVGHLIGTMLPEALQLAKLHFPGAQIQPPSRPVDTSWVKHGDPIPF